MNAALHPDVRRALLIFGTLGVAAVGALWLLREVLAPFAVCALIVYLLEPLVTRLSTQRLFGLPVSRGLAVVALYGCAGVILSLLITLLVPRFYDELSRMAHELPRQLDAVRQIHIPAWEAKVQAFSDQWGLGLDAHKMVHESLSNSMQVGEMEARTLTETVRSLLTGLFDALMVTVLILIVTALALRDAPQAKAYFWAAVPRRSRDPLRSLVTVLSRDLNGAIRGQLLICLINGFLTTIGLALLGINYAITIGLIAGICSLIPVFGTVISTVPAVLVAITQSWLTALEVVGVILLIHLIEANFLNPKVMGHNVELHPAIILSAIYIAEHYFGIAGLLLAVPVAAAMRSVVRFGYERYVAANAAAAEALPEEPAGIPAGVESR